VFVKILKKYKVKGDIVDNVVHFVAMTGGENMQDSGTQSETPQVKQTGPIPGYASCVRFLPVH
jgi:hypothetical protein